MKRIIFYIICLFPLKTFTQTVLVKGAIVGRQQNTSSNATTIRIHCTSSISVDKSPLYVIDGKINESVPKDFDVDSIKEITVLDCSAATALYGTRGVNGVILISTKPPGSKTFCAGYENPIL